MATTVRPDPRISRGRPCALWFALLEAGEKINPAQVTLLSRLEELVGSALRCACCAPGRVADPARRIYLDINRMISATLYNDPACPWAYSESPALRVIEWRYGDQLRWRLVLIGLTESASQYEARGYTPIRGALGQLSLPPALRDAVLTRPQGPAERHRARLPSGGSGSAGVTRSEWRVFRALQLANFTTPLLLDDDAQLVAVLEDLPGIDAQAIIARLDDSEVTAAYEQDRAASRTAAGSAAELQGKTATSDGPVRYTAPSIVFERNGLQMVAGGFQAVEAYDVLVTNVDPTLERQAPPATPAPLLERFPDGVTTQEVAALMTHGNDAPDRSAAEVALLELVAAGQALRQPLGDDALWRAA